MTRIKRAISNGRGRPMTELEFYAQEIMRWKGSPERIMQITGQRYYESDHDILTRKRTMIGEDGRVEEVENLPNNHVIDNQYGKLVNQKTNYIAGQPFVIEGKNDVYVELLKGVFNKRFMKTFKNAVKDSLNHGIAWLYPYYGDDGALMFRLFPGYEVLPFWRDREHTVLDAAVRLYQVEEYEGTDRKLTERAEIYDLSGVSRYIYESGTLIPDETVTTKESYVTSTDGEGQITALNWTRIPLVPVKYNEREIPLIKKVKSLQDGINAMLSDYENNMQEDARNTILVLKNYDGENLGEFRRNLATFGAVKVRYNGDTKGGVETLSVEVNSENYQKILELFKKALIENGMGYDAKDDRMSGEPNQMNIQSMYSDIDLDANDMETELQAAFEDILWFVNAYLANTGAGDFDSEKVNVIFNRDILINETEAIENCRASIGILSDETIVGQHPWVDDPQLELERLAKQREKELKEQETAVYDPFKSTQGASGGERRSE